MCIRDRFHPIPENNAWWGEGFTEWTNVAKARPQFQSHHQPIQPADLGFYDLRNQQTQNAQAQLAYDHLVHGFCYYYYWFGGRKLLEAPIENMLKSGSPDFPFCVCWANENWSRNWDGQNKHVLLKQSYDMLSNRRLIREFITLMKDPRYIRHHGKPVLLVYRIRVIPNWLETAEMWREECRRAGIGEIHLCAVRFGLEPLDGPPKEFGVDAYVLFPPHEAARIDARDQVRDIKPDFDGTIFSYDAVVDEDLSRFQDGYPWPVHRGAMLGWDNTARRPRDSRIFAGATPARFHQWVNGIIEQEDAHNEDPESLVFINAWNEWAEGTMLEPSSRFGHGYLEAVKKATNGLAAEAKPPTTITTDYSEPMIPSWVDGRRKPIKGAPTILVCAHVVSHQLFGAERSFLDVLRAISAMEVNVIVALPSAQHREYTNAVAEYATGVFIIHYRQWRDDLEPNDTVIQAFEELIDLYDIDLVYINTIVMREPLIAARNMVKKTIVHARELIDKDKGLQKQIGLPPDEIITNVHELSDYIIANSKTTQHLFFRENQTFCIPNIVEPEKLDIKNTVGSSITVGIVSSNIPKKGLDDFVALAHECDARGINAQLVIIGPENRHTQNIMDSSPPANLSIAGYRDTPAAAMAEIDVLVSLSEFAESFGRTVAEAQAARRPVIAYEWGAVSELIVENETGFLVPYRDVSAVADKIQLLSETPARISEMGESGRTYILSRYTPGMLQTRMHDALSTALSRPIVMRDTNRRITIVVPVFNAFEEVTACLASLERTVDFSAARVLIINDASTDQRITALVKSYAGKPGFTTLTNLKNVGYTGTINIGIRWAERDDIILLNSDTITTDGWVQGLVRAASDGIGTATAMGDNAGAFSFPAENSENTIPTGLTHEQHAQAILTQTSTCAPVETPTGSGFCMYIKRALFDDIGLFDADTFPRGYGEENDFCMRALNAGWKHVISPYTYIYHIRSASFGDEKQKLIKSAIDKVTHRHPDYASNVKTAFASDSMLTLRDAAQRGVTSD